MLKNANLFIAPAILTLLSVPAKAADPVAATPLGNPGEWATSSDYPAASLRAGVEGTVGFRVATGENGVVTACEITRSSGSAELDEQTCNLVRMRARFKPAKDGMGRSVAGSYSNSIRWVVPKSAPSDFAPFSSVLTFTIDENGRALDCQWKNTGKTPAAAGELPTPCDTTTQVFMPLFDATGKPVARRVKFTTSAEFVEAK